MFDVLQKRTNITEIVRLYWWFEQIKLSYIYALKFNFLSTPSVIIKNQIRKIHNSAIPFIKEVTNIVSFIFMRSIMYNNHASSNFDSRI